MTDIIKPGMVPNMVFFTKGVGNHKAKLQSFEFALREAGIERYNLVRVSSILPPNCKIINPEEGIKNLLPGQITYCVLSENSTNEAERVIGAAIGMAVPKEPKQYGYISEYHSFGENKQYMKDYAEDLATTMLASTLGIDFDPEKGYDERKEIYRISGKIIDSYSIAAVARGNGNWTTVLSAAVFVF